MTYQVFKARDEITCTEVPVATPHVIHSAIECPYKYKVEYHKGIRDKKIKSTALTGILVHKAIENFYTKNHLQENYKTILPEVVLTLYNQVKEEYNEAIEKTINYGIEFEDREYKAPELTKYFITIAGKKYGELIKHLSSLKELTDVVDLKGSSILFILNQAEKCYSNFLKWENKHNINNSGKIQGIEHKLPLTYLNGHPCSGTIDLLTEDTVIDWKTAYTPFLEEEIRNSFQLQWYAYFAKVPNVAVLNLRSNKFSKINFSEKDLTKIKNNLIMKIEKKRQVDSLIHDDNLLKNLQNPLGSRSNYNCPCPLLTSVENTCIYRLESL